MWVCHKCDEKYPWFEVEYRYEQEIKTGECDLCKRDNLVCYYYMDMELKKVQKQIAKRSNSNSASDQTATNLAQTVEDLEQTVESLRQEVRNLRSRVVLLENTVGKQLSDQE